MRVTREIRGVRFWQNVWRALRPGEHCICGVIVLEFFLFRIPMQRAPGLHGDVMEQARRAGTVRDLSRRNRFLPAADAVQPIAVVIGTFVQMNLIPADRGFYDPGIACG